MADDFTIVKLRKPYQGHRGMVRELKFRAPVYRDIMALGEPGLLVQTPDGSRFVQESIGVIDEYAKRLLVDEDAMLMEQASTVDALAIKEAIQGFFHSAQADLHRTATAPAYIENAPAPSSSSTG